MPLSKAVTEHYKNAKTIIVKVGSNILTEESKGANQSAINSLVAGISKYHSDGKQVILVSSGAVGCGKTLIKSKSKNISVPQKQALSAIGQIQLMHLYSEAFNKKGIVASQVLLTRNSLKDRNQYHNLSNCITSLFAWGVVPIINENDALATEELSIGDNDTIAALIATRLGADLLILLTAVDGLLDSDGITIPELKKIVTSEYNFNVGGPKSTFGTGGMQSKLDAAKLAVTNGTPVIIANGFKKNILQNITNGKSSGTFIHPSGNKLHSKKAWILAATSKKRGHVVIDDGACKAIINNGKSLLPAGIVNINGSFKAGEVVNVVNNKGNCIAVGISNLCSLDAEKVKGKHSKQISKVLEINTYDELIHRDNLVIIDR